MAKKLTHEVYLYLGDDIVRAKGTSMYDALSKLKPNSKFKKPGTITVKVDGKESKVGGRIPITKLKRLFANPWEMELFAKKLEILR